MTPQRIAFIGESKSGKTTLIDTLLGYNILPRGFKSFQNLELKVVHTTELPAPIVEHLDNDDKVIKTFTSLGDVRPYIQRILQGTSEQKMSQKIKIKITSPSSADMTLIDSINLDEKKPLTREYVKRLISDSNTLIILVMNCLHLLNEHVHIRDKWFRLIKEIDSSLSRTICVFTQCDNLPGSYNYNRLREFLRKNNNVLDLKYGFICCKLGFSSNISASDFNHLEKEYFSSHKVFQFLPLNDFFTVESIGERITKFIWDTYSFQKNVKIMHQKLRERIATNEKEMVKYGNNYIDFTSSSKELYLQSLVNEFCENVDKTFSGKAEFEEDNLINTELQKLYVEFLDTFVSIKPSKECNNENIIKIIQQSEGWQLSGFPSCDVIYSCLEQEIETLRNEIKAFLDNVYMIVSRLIKTLINRIFGRFPKALSQIEELIIGFINVEFGKSKKIILNISEMNFNYLYIDERASYYQELLKTTLLKDQINEANKLNQANYQNQNNTNQMNKGTLQNQKRQGNLNNQNIQNEQKSIKKEEEISFFKSQKDKNSYYISLSDYVKALVDFIYVEILRCLREYLPKVTGHFYIKSLKTNMRYYLLSYISKNPQFVENLEEDREQLEKRKYYIESTEKLKNIAKQISYDDSLMKIIKSDVKTIDDIIQSQMKIDPNRNKSSDKVKEIQNKKEEEKVKEKEKPSLFGVFKSKESKKEENTKTNNLFGKPSNNKNANAGTNPNANQKPTLNLQEQNKNTQTKTNNPILANLFGAKPNQNQGNNTGPSSQTSSQTNIRNPQNQQPQPQNQKQQQQSQNYQNQQKYQNSNQNPNQNQNQGINFNFRYDPNSNQVKDVNIQGKIDYQTAKNFYDNNKQYLPSKEQMVKGAKATYNLTSNVVNQGMSNENAQKKKDPLINLFGSKK